MRVERAAQIEGELVDDKVEGDADLISQAARQ